MRIQITLALSLLCCAFAFPATAQDEVREWTDSTGRFKVTGALQEVSDGVVILRREDGKLLRIPLARLSKTDQAFIEGGASPFEMVDADSTSSTSPAAAGGGTSGPLWSTDTPVNWDQAETFTSLAGVSWQVPEINGALDFEPKRAPLTRKESFHEHMHPVVVNPRCKRAVVGRTVSFAVPKPLTRLALVDLATGKAVQSEPVEADMRPLALLDNGSSILMVGNGDGRGGYETRDQLQIWRFDGKRIVRSGTWTPYAKDNDNGRNNGQVLVAEVISADRVVTISDKGHIALWNLATRRPVWHGRLSERNFAMDLSTDRKALAVFDEKTLMVIQPETAEILGSTALPQNANTGWVKVAWSPSGKKLLVTSVADIRVMDVATGQWTIDFSIPGGHPVATAALSYPDEDYALLDNRLLIHLPSKIQVCEYRDAAAIETIGGTSFIALHSDAGGLLAPGKFPHPPAAEILQKAMDDPSLFLIHPGVEVAIDVSGVGQQHREAARQGLEKSATASGYKVAASSPIKITAAITGPKQEAVSYIAAGSYVVQQYTSTIKLTWNGQDLWSTQGTNIPGVLMTKRGQTMQQALDEAGKSPNTSMFANARFPEFMQRPAEGGASGRRSSALMSSQFTLQGLVDGK